MRHPVDAIGGTRNDRVTASDQSRRDLHGDVLAVPSCRTRPNDRGRDLVDEELGIASYPQGDGSAVPEVIHSGWPVRMLRRDKFRAKSRCRSERHLDRPGRELREHAFTERAELLLVGRIAFPVEDCFECFGCVQARDEFSGVLIARRDDCGLLFRCQSLSLSKRFCAACKGGPIIDPPLQLPLVGLAQRIGLAGARP